MTYIRRVVTVAALVLPLILLYKLWYGRRSFEDSNIDNDNELTDSTSVIDAPFVTSESEDPPNSFPSVEYEVFLSFRGPDTRNQITDILYRFLCHTKIHTFKDDNELRKGEEIRSNLLQAIDQSKIYVPIISKNYAHSKWCLIELAEIIRRQEQDTRRIILPIFYMVDPRDVRHQTGPYENAFQEHCKKFDETTIKNWKDALNKIGALKGWHVKNNDEQGAVADEVSADLFSRLSKENFTLETDELVGIDDHVDVVVEKLNLDSKNLTMVGLHGMGGIGKTTIAKAVYNKISSRFDRCCFVENIREIQAQKDGIVVLQKRLVSEILRMDSVDQFAHDSVGRKMIKERVSRFKSLIVLDDVDEKFRFQDILGSPKDFVSESRFIITSRNVNVLITLIENEYKLYEVGSLNHPHSLELFCKHAFRKNSPSVDYETLADDIVQTTGGLPLTLKVIGSLLFRQETAFWKDKLEQLRETLQLDQVMDRLKISYDTLAYDAQQIFLDIACFFIGTNKEMPSYMWSDCKLYPMSNINILIQRSMIKLGDEDVFQMHDQLRDMGREIIRRENIEHPWMRSRIWSAKEGKKLIYERKGSNLIKGLRVENLSIGVDAIKSLKKLSELRYFEADSSTTLVKDLNNFLPNLRWLQLHRYNRKECEPPLTNFNMKNLVILDLRESFLPDNWGGWSQIQMAERLKLIDLSHCSKFRRLPRFPRSLEILRLSYIINGQEIPELDIGELKKLKVLRLNSSKIQKITGGTFGMLKGLQELDLTDFECENFREVMVDVGQLSSLKILRTRWVKEVEYETPIGLKELYTSSRISNLAEMLELEVLKIYDCKFGFDIPPMWWKRSKLKTLWIENTNINGGGSSSNNNMITTTMLPSLPSLERITPLSKLQKLKQLTIAGAHSLREIKGLGENLTDLQMDGIDCQGLCNHLDGIEGLTSLKKLRIQEVKGLARITGLTNLLSSPDCKLDDLTIFSCPDLIELHDDDKVAEVGVVVNSLRLMHIVHCPQLDAGPLVRGLTKFPMLRALWLENIKFTEHQLEGVGSLKELGFCILKLPSLERITQLSKLQKLKYLTIAGAHGLREIEGLGELKSLEYLILPNCTSLERLWHADDRLENLKELDIRNCRSLSVEHLSALQTVTSLHMYQCHAWLPSLVNLGNLTHLEMVDCQTLCNHLDGIEGLTSLEKLRIDEVKGLARVTGLTNLLSLPDCKLEDLIIVKCPDIIELHDDKATEVGVVVNSLQLMHIVDCPQLDAGPLVRGLTKFPMLRVLWLENIKRITPLSKLKKLKQLTIASAHGLREIEGLGELKSLERLILRNCTSLERLWHADDRPENLMRLDIRNCRSLSVEHLSALEAGLPPNVEISWPDEPCEDDETDSS
ncbi:Disease resistance protein L6 [Linum perenne]